MTAPGWGNCSKCEVLTSEGIGCNWLCTACQKEFVMPPRVIDIERENQELKQRILRLEARIAELTLTGEKQLYA